MSIRKDKAKATFDLVAVGECSLDIVARGGAPWPVDGKTHLASLQLMTGGQAATLAVGVARQGWRAGYVGVVGDDGWGRRIEADLDADDVDFRGVRRKGAATRAAVILVDAATGRRAVLEHRSARLDFEPGEFDATVVTSARMLSVDATDARLAIHAATIARAAGVPVMVDVDRAGPQEEQLLRLIDFLIVPEAFARDVTGTSTPGAALDALARAYAPALAVVTLGADGAVARQGAAEVYVRALPIDAIDTTGAGDAFRAGFAAAWLASRGKAQLSDLLRWATVTAGLNCLGQGAQAGLPTRTAVEAAIRAGVTLGDGTGLND